MPARPNDPLCCHQFRRFAEAEMNVDLNCDLGEREGLLRRRALMRWITSANVACGGHAGNKRSMESCVRLASQFNIRLGAHPGVAANFGRGPVQIRPAKLEA